MNQWHERKSPFAFLIFRYYNSVMSKSEFSKPLDIWKELYFNLLNRVYVRYVLPDHLVAISHLKRGLEPRSESTRWISTQIEMVNFDGRQEVVCIKGANWFQVGGGKMQVARFCWLNSFFCVHVETLRIQNLP